MQKPSILKILTHRPKRTILQTASSNWCLNKCKSMKVLERNEGFFKHDLLWLTNRNLSSVSRFSVMITHTKHSEKCCQSGAQCVCNDNTHLGKRIEVGIINRSPGYRSSNTISETLVMWDSISELQFDMIRIRSDPRIDYVHMVETSCYGTMTNQDTCSCAMRGTRKEIWWKQRTWATETKLKRKHMLI